MSGTKRRPEHAAPDDSPALVTGVASGGLGTGANLDETQVLRTTQAAPEEHAAFAAAEPSPVDSGPVAPDPAMPAAAAPAAVASAPDESAPVEPAPVAPIRSTGVRPRPDARGRPARALAGVLAAVFLVLAGVAFLTTAKEATLGTGQSAPAIGPAVTAEPTAGEGDGDGKCKGKGNGNGNGNCGDGDGDGGGEGGGGDD